MDPPGLVDSHAHLDPLQLGDELDAVLRRAGAAGVTQIVNVGSGADVGCCERALAVAEATPGVFAAIGIHPHDVDGMAADALARIEELARRHPRVVAIGETGLDYHYDHSPRDRQRDALREFVALARRVGKPLVLHIRDAHEDARALLAETGAGEVGGVVHCFTGEADDARAYLELGFSISFSGILTFKSAEGIRRAAALVPPERALVETDCPFLAPVPHRGKRNEPAWVALTADALATVQGASPAEARRTSTDAARRTFRLDSSDVLPYR